MVKKKMIIGVVMVILLAVAGGLIGGLSDQRGKNDDEKQLSEEQQERLAAEETELLSVTESWGLSSSDELADIKESAEKYLDQYQDGMEIDSAEFYDYAKYLFNVADDYTLTLEQKAKEDTEFARFYFYASVYNNAVDADMVNMESYQMSDELLAMNVEEAVHWIAAEMVKIAMR